jgi:hypothetical protein
MTDLKKVADVSEYDLETQIATDVQVPDWPASLPMTDEQRLLPARIRRKEEAYINVGIIARQLMSCMRAVIQHGQHGKYLFAPWLKLQGMDVQSGR